MDKISIITVTYNCADEIEKTILSVLEQNYPAIEYIIIDGASTDGTVDIIKKYADKVAYWVSEPDKGLYFAMNKGIEQATGDWIYIHNAGNIFHDSHSLSNIFKRDLKGVDAVYGYIFSRVQGKYLRRPKPFYADPNPRTKRMGFSHQAIFVRTEWVKNYLFDTTKYRCCADYNMMVKIYNAGAKFAYVDVAVCKSAPAGFSERNRKLQFRETSQINGVYGTFWYYWHYNIMCVKRWLKEIKNK